MDDISKFLRGMFFATLFSIPLWLSFFGWIKLIKNVITIPHI